MDVALRKITDWRTVQIRKDTTCSVCYLPIYRRDGVALRPPQTSSLRAARIHGGCLAILKKPVPAEAP